MRDNNCLPMSMISLLDHVADQAGGDRVSLADILQTLGTRSYGPALLFVALVSMLPPISVTPGLPMITGSLIVILSLQLLFSRPNPWLPKRILHVSWTRENLGKTLQRARPWAMRLDGLSLSAQNRPGRGA